MVSSNKLIEQIASGIMLGSFAVYGNNGRCCTSGKKANPADDFGSYNYADNIKVENEGTATFDNYIAKNKIQQEVIGNRLNAIHELFEGIRGDLNKNTDEIQKTNEKISDINSEINSISIKQSSLNSEINIISDKQSNLKKEFEASKEKPAEVTKVVYKKANLTGTIDLGKDKSVFNLNLLHYLKDIIEELTNENIGDDFISENKNLADIYTINNANLKLNIKKEYGKYMMDLNKVRGIMEKIISIQENICQGIVNKGLTDEAQDQLAKANSYFIRYNQLLVYILTNTLEKMLLMMYNRTNTYTNNLKEKDIKSPLYIISYFTSLYEDISKMSFYMNQSTTRLELNNILDLMTTIQKFNNGEFKFNHLQGLTDSLKIVEDATLAKGTMAFKLRYCIMKTINEFILAFYNKLLTKFSFLSAGDEINLNLKLYPNVTLLYAYNAAIENLHFEGIKNEATLLKHIGQTDFEYLKMLYNSLCDIDDSIFGKIFDARANISSEKGLKSIMNFYTIVKDKKDPLSDYFNEYIFNLNVCGKNDPTHANTTICYPFKKCLNIDLKRSYVQIKKNSMSRPISFTYQDTVKDPAHDIE